MIIEKILEMRGMRRSEIINYFISIEGKQIGQGNFRGQDWEVEVGEENLIFIGSLKIPCTKVLFRSDEEQLEKMICKFRLKFLSAGG